MQVAARYERNADFELPGQILLLRFVKPAQQATTTILTPDADRAIDVAFKGAQRLSFKHESIVRFKQLRNHRRTGIKLLSKRAQKPGDLLIDNSYHCAEIFGDRRRLLVRELRG